MPACQPEELGSVPPEISLAPSAAGEPGAEGQRSSLTPHAGPWCLSSSVSISSNPGWCEVVLALPDGGCSPGSVHPSFALGRSSRKLLLEIVPRCLLGAGEVSGDEASQPSPAAAQRQVLGAEVTAVCR